MRMRLNSHHLTLHVVSRVCLARRFSTSATNTQMSLSDLIILPHTFLSGELGRR